MKRQVLLTVRIKENIFLNIVCFYLESAGLS